MLYLPLSEETKKRTSMPEASKQSEISKRIVLVFDLCALSFIFFPVHKLMHA